MMILRLFPCLFLFFPLLAVPVQSADITAAFSPHGQSLELMLSTIKSAKKSIHVAAYRFTSKPIAEALKDAYRRGMDVKLVADAKRNNSRYTAVTFLLHQGIPVRLNSQYAIHHNMFMIVDGQHVQTGSFSYSAAAGKNAENVLVVRDEPELAAQYEQEWQRLWGEGRTADTGVFLLKTKPRSSAKEIEVDAD